LLQKFTSSEGYFVPTVDDVYDNAPEQKALAATEAANGGIKIDANGAVFGMRTALKDRFVGEDITLRFNNYNYNNGSLVVGLTSSVNPGAIWNFEAATGRFGVYFCIGYNNSVWVTVPYQANTMTQILTDESLSNDNLMNKEFFVNIKCTPYTYTYSSSAGPISVTRYKITFAITVDGKTLTANIDEKITTTPVGGTYSGAMDQFKPDEAQVVIESLAGYNPSTGVSNNVIGQATSIELTGIKSLPYSSADAAKVDAVIAAINALPDTASLSIRDQVDDVWNQYFELITPAARAGVTNYSKLKALHDGIFNLRRGSSIVTEYVDVDVVVNKIDNSGLVTPYVDDSQVKYDSTGIWPEWTKDLVMAEVNLSKATEGGTILKEDVEPLLQHLAETGINGLWVLPINDTGIDTTSPYCNYGPHTICPYLTGVLPYGTDYSEFDGDYTQGFANFKEFVDLAHSYNIRIFMDIVPWGVSHYAPIVTEHPEYFYGDSSWGGRAYDENNKNGYFNDLEAWYMDSIVDSYLATGIDGIRWDLEPNHFGFDTVEKVLDTLKAAGKKPLFFSEDITSRSDPDDPSIIAYAFEQCYGVTGKGVGSQTVSEVFFKDVDIVKAIKTGAHIGESTTRPQWATNGAAKYYAYQMSSHDVIGYHQSSLASWAYEYAFSSFIPIFYVGEEWQSKHNGGLSGLEIKWSELEDPAHAEYFESVKKLLGLRWMYKDMLNSTVDNHKNTNICSVDVIGSDHVKGYARYAGNEAIVVVPNVNEKSTAAAEFTVELPISDMGLTGYNYYTVTDMLTGDMVVSGSAAEVAYFSETIEHNTAGVYLVSGNATDVTWSVNESGTLVISGTGAVQDAPWASANTTVNKVVVESGITSLPADAFANFEELTTVCLPATVNALPNMAQDTVVIVVEGSTAERLAKAAGYTVAYNSELEIDTITVVVGDGSKTVEVVLDASCAGSYTDIKAIFGTTVVTEYETIGKKVIFKYTTTDEDVTIKLEGTDILGEPASTDTASINLSRMNGAAGTRYVQYLEIDCGDANGDGVTDIKDLVRAKKMVAQLADSNSTADLSGDGNVAAADLTLLAKLIVKGKKGMEAYTVTFAEAESDVIYDVVYVPAGFKATTDVLPVKEDTFFAGWDKSLANVSEDMVVYATFSNDVGADFSEGDLSGEIPEDWEYGD
ncbi:MAG: hypothetical protein J6I80_03865, partial [Clostridia bacterium]|nr:hypothetical protein [Clostridia bacterium]